MSAGQVPGDHATALAMALLDALDDTALRELADRMRPHLQERTYELLDARTAAARLGLHPETLARMAREGRIWAEKVGREWRFRTDRLQIKPVARRGTLVAAGQPGRVGRPDRASVTAIRGRL